MKPRVILITKKSFANFLYKFFPDFNFENKEYFDIIQKEYFDIVNNKELPMFTAKPYLRNILVNKGFNKSRPDKISRWNSLGYFDVNVIRSEAYRYSKKNKKYKDVVFNNDDAKIKMLLIKTLGIFNFDNEQYYDDVKSKLFDGVVFVSCTSSKNNILKIIYGSNKPPKSGLSIIYWTARGFSIEYAKQKISNIQKTRSKMCSEYYLKRGFSEYESKKKVSEWQTNACTKSKSTKEYWLNIGFSADDAKKLASEYSSKRSVWAKSHWMRLGYTEEEAEKKILEYNPSSISFKNYQHDLGLYTRMIKKASVNAKERWKKDSYVSKKILAVKEGRISKRGISKGECEMFDFLNNFVNKNIKHSPYVVAIPEDSSTSINTYFYACDGYLETEDKNIIIIEYDGRLYHHEKIDEIRDSDILMIDNKVIGILRISDRFFKDKKILQDEKINRINNAIQKIKDTTEGRIKL